MLEPNKDTIAVLDCGGQYAHLIANRIRRLHVFSEIFQSSTKAEDLKEAKGIIISGGPQSVFADGSPQVDPAIFELGIPVLGICYGHQLMAHTLEGTVKPGHGGEYGKAYVEKQADVDNTVFEGWSDREQVWMSHGDEVVELPDGFEVIYSTDDCPMAAMANRDKNFYGIQFHGEVTHTPNGNMIFENFLKICGTREQWNMETFIEEEMTKIRQQVGNKNVFLLTSGGVDSTVAFLMLSKALGNDRVYGLFVDTGFMRKDEIEEVESSLKELGFDNLHTADAKDHFFENLKEIYDPERKRNIIGAEFLEVKDQWAEKIGLDSENWLLGQGTIYPDTIESGGTEHAATIKTHHNRIDQIEKLIHEGRIVEPIKELYKDEVRELGEKLGLSEALTWRHPFPGPGLAIRILCGKEADVLESSEDLEKIIKDEHGLESKVLPIKSVGVQGDSRSYAHPLALFLGDEKIDWDKHDTTATTVTNKHKAVNRVILCTSHTEAPENIHFVNGYLTPERVKTLQEVDAIVKDFLIENKLMREIWQFPVVLLPLGCEGEKEAVVLRPVDSKEAMTASFSRIDEALLKELNERIMKSGKVSMVFYDITNKPPGTIEWE